MLVKRTERKTQLSAGRIQLDVQQAVADVVTELPYDTAATMLDHLSGIAVSSERMHTLTHQVAADLTVLDVAPSREAIKQRVAAVAASATAPLLASCTHKCSRQGCTATFV